MLTFTFHAKVNIALRKNTGQSSTLNGISGHAVDGLWKPKWSSLSCTQTHREQNPYWFVDLEDRYAIENVWVLNRVDCCRKYFKDSCPIIKGTVVTPI